LKISLEKSQKNIIFLNRVLTSDLMKNSYVKRGKVKNRPTLAPFKTLINFYYWLIIKFRLIGLEPDCGLSWSGQQEDPDMIMVVKTTMTKFTFFIFLVFWFLKFGFRCKTILQITINSFLFEFDCLYALKRLNDKVYFLLKSLLLKTSLHQILTNLSQYLDDDMTRHLF